MQASVVVAHGLWSAGSVVVVHGLSCSAACGLFPDQSSNPCPLHWQADSQPLRHQGSPSNPIFFFFAGRGWTLHWVFVAVLGLSLVAVSGGYSSLRWLLLLRSTGSRRTGFSSCSMWAQLLRGMWDVPGPGTEPVSPTLAGGFSFIFNYLII